MKKIVIPLLAVLIFASCDFGDLFGNNENVLRNLDGDWAIDLDNTIFDAGNPSYVNRYVIMTFDTDGSIQQINILDDTKTTFETDRIENISINSSQNSGGFETTITVFTPDKTFVGNETYWTYEISGDNLVLEVFADNSQKERYVKFVCTRKE